MDSIDKALNKDLEVNETVKSTIEIKYRPAKFFRRLMANLFDFIIFIIVFVALFLASRAVIVRQENYKEAFSLYRNAQIESGLYFDDKSSTYPSIVEYIDENGNYTHEGKHLKSKAAVITFYTYIINENDDEVIHTKIIEEYKEYFTSEKIKPYINNIAFNSLSITIDELTDDKLSDLSFYNEVYKPFINNKLLALFANYAPQYKLNINYVAKLFLFIAFPIAFVLAGVLVYLVPPLCFRRGRMSLGKAMYNIGLVDANYLHVKTGRYLARFAIFFFGELVLSLFTFAIPFVISFTLMAFSKNKQAFPDYMLRLREIDGSSNKIYYSLEEIKLSGVESHRHVEFQPEKEI